MAPKTPRKPTKASVKAKADRAEARAKGKPVIDETSETGPLNPPETRKRYPHPGQPEKYDPAYCELVLEWGQQGKSKTWMAAELGIAKQTLANWADQHPEFLAALTRAKTLEQKWWEDAGQRNLTTSGFAQTMWGRSMAARFPDEWRETSRQEIGGKDGGPLQVDVADVSALEVARWVADVLTTGASLPAKAITDESEEKP
jgi:transposase